MHIQQLGMPYLNDKKRKTGAMRMQPDSIPFLTNYHIKEIACGLEHVWCIFHSCIFHSCMFHSYMFHSKVWTTFCQQSPPPPSSKPPPPSPYMCISNGQQRRKKGKNNDIVFCDIAFCDIMLCDIIFAVLCTCDITCVCVCVLMQLCRLLQIQHLCNWASMTCAKHTATYCNTLQHTCSCNCRTCVIQRANTPQEHTGNTLQHTATRCNTREVALIELPQLSEQTRCNNTPQHTATHRNTPQYTATLRWLQS